VDVVEVPMPVLDVVELPVLVLVVTGDVEAVVVLPAPLVVDVVEVPMLVLDVVELPVLVVDVVAPPPPVPRFPRVLASARRASRRCMRSMGRLCCAKVRSAVAPPLVAWILYSAIERLCARICPRMYVPSNDGADCPAVAGTSRGGIDVSVGGRSAPLADDAWTSCC
jgi:hypothetical protein